MFFGVSWDVAAHVAVHADPRSGFGLRYKTRRCQSRASGLGASFEPRDIGTDRYTRVDSLLAQYGEEDISWDGSENLGQEFRNHERKDSARPFFFCNSHCHYF